VSIRIPPDLRQALHYGASRKPIALVVPDANYPGVMWRIRWPDGRLSGMVNLARAKDAAMALAEHGPPHRNPQRLHWELHRSESLSGGRGRVLHLDPTPDTIPPRAAIMIIATVKPTPWGRR
jgi:hypothetical protein